MNWVSQTYHCPSDYDIPVPPLWPGHRSDFHGCLWNTTNPVDRCHFWAQLNKLHELSVLIIDRISSATFHMRRAFIKFPLYEIIHNEYIRDQTLNKKLDCLNVWTIYLLGIQSEHTESDHGEWKVLNTCLVHSMFITKAHQSALSIPLVKEWDQGNWFTQDGQCYKLHRERAQTEMFSVWIQLRLNERHPRLSISMCI